MARKIDVYSYDTEKGETVYLWSSNRYNSIREAIINCAITFGQGKLASIQPETIRAYYSK